VDVSFTLRKYDIEDERYEEMTYLHEKRSSFTSGDILGQVQNPPIL